MNQGITWLTELCSLCEQREEIIKQLADAPIAETFSENVSVLKKETNLVFQPSLNPDQRNAHISTTVQAIEKLLQIVESTKGEFSSGMVLQDQTSQQNLDFLSSASERLKKAVQGLYQASKNLRANYKDLVMQDKLGEGNFGTVWKAQWRATTCAVKQVKKEKITQEDYEAFLNEAALMMKIPPHPNVTMLVGICEDPFCLITEYVMHGSLENLLQNPKYKPISMDQKCKWMYEIAQGMLHLQKNNIIHSDLASRNVLVT